MKEYPTVKIYKEGGLVRKKKYQFHYRKEWDAKELGKTSLEEVIDYQFNYYAE